MSVKRKVKMGCALLLAAVLLLTGQGVLETRAAGSVDLNRDCSLTISVEIGREGGSNAAYLNDLNNMTIPVSVYRVADVDVTGQKYTTVEPFSTTGSALSANLGAIGSETTADDWQRMAGEASTILKDKEAAAKAASGCAVASVKKEVGSEEAARATINGLKPGLYLVVADSVVASSGKQYSFTPYLVALPGIADADMEERPEDEWIYDVTVGLKPGVTSTPGGGGDTPGNPQSRYGKLTITKNLQDFNQTFGRTTFVFRIVGVDTHGTTQYEEVASLDFDAPGNKSVTLDQIPVGLKVTVTEVYSGASYEVVGPKEQTVTIVSDSAVSGGGQQAASVSFANRYNGGNRVGYGVDNRFKSDGRNGWTWENPTQSAGR